MDFGEDLSPFKTGTPMYKMYMEETIADDWTRQLVLTEEYDQSYGIYDHERHRDKDPLSIIAQHPAEDYITGNRLEMLMRELIACRIPEITNTPLAELLQYPRYLLDMLLKDGRKARVKEEQITNQLSLDLDHMKR